MSGGSDPPIWRPFIVQNRRGMNRSIDSPTASVAAHPNICSAALLKPVTRWASSTVMMASIAEEMIPLNRASLCSRFS